MSSQAPAAHRVEIEFCVPGDFRSQAVGLTRELLDGWAQVLREVKLVPSSRGRFEVTLDGELIFSKEALDRHAEPGEITASIAARLGPAASFG